MPKQSSNTKTYESHSQSSSHNNNKRRNKSKLSLNNFFTVRDSIFDNESESIKDSMAFQQVIQTSDVNVTDSDLEINVMQTEGLRMETGKHSNNLQLFDDKQKGSARASYGSSSGQLASLMKRNTAQSNRANKRPQSI